MRSLRTKGTLLFGICFWRIVLFAALATGGIFLCLLGVLSKGAMGWQLVKDSDGEFASRVTIPPQLAWRVFTKGVDRESARAQIQIEGHRDLEEKVLQLTAIVA